MTPGQRATIDRLRARRAQLATAAERIAFDNGSEDSEDPALHLVAAMEEPPKLVDPRTLVAGQRFRRSGDAPELVFTAVAVGRGPKHRTLKVLVDEAEVPLIFRYGEFIELVDPNPSKEEIPC